jgi:hypothetical protein
MPTEAPPPRPTSILVIPPDEGRSATAGIAHTPLGAGPPPQVHRCDDEVFVVLKGLES